MYYIVSLDPEVLFHKTSTATTASLALHFCLSAARILMMETGRLLTKLRTVRHDH